MEPKKCPKCLYPKTLVTQRISGKTFWMCLPCYLEALGDFLLKITEEKNREPWEQDPESWKHN